MQHEITEQIITVILAILFILSMVVPAIAETPPDIITLDATVREFNLHPYLEILKDPDGTLTIEDVSAPEFDHQFARHGDGRAPNYGYTDSVMWLRFHLKPPELEEKLLLEIGYALLDQVDFYYPHINNGYSHMQAGHSIPFYKRDVEYRNPAFNMPSTWDSAEPFYIRVDTKTAMIVPVALWESGSFQANIIRDYLGLGMFYGILLIAIVFALFMFAHLREVNYLYYAFFVLSITLFLFTYNGLSFQYLWPANPWWAQKSILVFIFLSVVSAVPIMSSISSARQYAPLLQRVLLVIATLSALMVPLSLIIDFTLAMKIGIAATVIGSIVIITTVYICWRNKYRPAAYLLGSWVFNLTGLLLVSGRSFGLLPDIFITRYGGHVSFIGMLILLFFATADHMLFSRKEKEYFFELATYDSLTSLLNRRAFLHHAKKEIETARHSSGSFSIVLIDIDKFKLINDNLGHAAGDEVLLQFAVTIKNQLRQNDIAGRIGGEEFALLLSGTGLDEALILAERLRSTIENSPANYQGKEICYTISAGVAEYNRSITNLDQLLKKADDAMYEAKNKGRNRVVG